MNNGWGNRIGIQVWDCSQEVSDLLRLLMIPCSQTKKRFIHDCDTIQHRTCLGYTNWVSDGSETSSDYLGLITDFLRELWPIFLLSFAWWVGDRSGIKFRPPETKTKPTCHLQSQEVSDNIGLCKYGSEEVSGSLRLEYVWAGVTVDRLRLTCLIFKPTPTDPNRVEQTVWDSIFFGNRSPKSLNREP